MQLTLRPLRWEERDILLKQKIRYKDDETMEYVVVGFRLRYFSEREKLESVNNPMQCLAIVINEIGPMSVSFQNLFDDWEWIDSGDKKIGAPL